jgi:hypothetical protein
MASCGQFLAAVLLCVLCVLCVAEQWDVSTLSDRDRNRDGFISPDEQQAEPLSISVDTSTDAYIYAAAIIRRERVRDTPLFEILRLDITSTPVVQVSLVGPSTGGHMDGAATLARFNDPMGLAYSRDGKWIAVADTNNHLLRRVDAATGEVSTLAGCGDAPEGFCQTKLGHADGSAQSARFNMPFSVAFEPGTQFTTQFTTQCT